MTAVRYPLALSALVALALTSCATAPGVGAAASPALLAAVSNKTLDSPAIQTCAALYPDSDFVAALNSDAKGVRAMSSVPPSGSEPDTHGLPSDGDAPVTVCISAHLGGEDIYMATWMTDRETGVLAVFDSTGALTRL